LIAAGIALIVLAFVPDLIPQAVGLFFEYVYTPSGLSFLTDWITPEALTPSLLMIGGIVLIAVGFALALIEFGDEISLRTFSRKRN
jgi:hypothetical protein